VRPEKRRAMSESELALFAVMDKTRQEATLRQDYKHSFEAD
jgi:hypothetical protein